MEEAPHADEHEGGPPPPGLMWVPGKIDAMSCP